MHTRRLLLSFLLLGLAGGVAAAGVPPPESVSPADPREGDEIVVGTYGSEVCETLTSFKVEHRKGESVVTIYAGPPYRPDCMVLRPYGAPPLVGVNVGKLPAGKYRIVIRGEVRFHIQVRPKAKPRPTAYRRSHLFATTAA